MQNQNQQPGNGAPITDGRQLLTRSCDFLTGYAFAAEAMSSEELDALRADFDAHDDKEYALRYMHKVLSAIVAQLDASGDESGKIVQLVPSDPAE
jgi:hypothetical protein